MIDMGVTCPKDPNKIKKLPRYAERDPGKKSQIVRKGKLLRTRTLFWAKPNH